jgi:hypothetical protein
LRSTTAKEAVYREGTCGTQSVVEDIVPIRIAVERGLDHFDNGPENDSAEPCGRIPEKRIAQQGSLRFSQQEYGYNCERGRVRRVLQNIYEASLARQIAEDHDRQNSS